MKLTFPRHSNLLRCNCIYILVGMGIVKVLSVLLLLSILLIGPVL